MRRRHVHGRWAPCRRDLLTGEVERGWRCEVCGEFQFVPPLESQLDLFPVPLRPVRLVQTVTAKGQHGFRLARQQLTDV